MKGVFTNKSEAWKVGAICRVLGINVDPKACCVRDWIKSQPWRYVSAAALIYVCRIDPERRVLDVCSEIVAGIRWGRCLETNREVYWWSRDDHPGNSGIYFHRWSITTYFDAG
jgi:hypothetical protein